MSGVLDVIEMLMVALDLRQRGDDTGTEFSVVVTFRLLCCRVGSICHLSRGGDGGCFKRIRSLS